MFQSVHQSFGEEEQPDRPQRCAAEETGSPCRNIWSNYWNSFYLVDLVLNYDFNSYLIYEKKNDYLIFILKTRKLLSVSQLLIFGCVCVIVGAKVFHHRVLSRPNNEVGTSLDIRWHRTVSREFKLELCLYKIAYSILVYTCICNSCPRFNLDIWL